MVVKLKNNIFLLKKREFFWRTKFACGLSAHGGARGAVGECIYVTAQSNITLYDGL